MSRAPADAPSGLPAAPRPARRPWPDPAHAFTGTLLVLACHVLVVVLEAAQPGLRAGLPGFLTALLGALTAVTPPLLAVVGAAYGLTRMCTSTGRGGSPSADARHHERTRPRWLR